MDHKYLIYSLVMCNPNSTFNVVRSTQWVENRLNLIEISSIVLKLVYRCIDSAIALAHKSCEENSDI